MHDLGTTCLVNNIEIDVDMNNTPNYNNNLEDEQMLVEIKENILRKWKVLKEENMAERSVLPKVKPDKKLKKIMERTNKANEQIKLSNPNFNLAELNQLVYTAASAITDERGLKSRKSNNKKRKQPAWKLKIMKDIETKRKVLSIIAELENGSRVKVRKARKERNIENKYKLERNQSITELKEIIRKQMQAKAQGIRRFEKRSKFCRQNKIFEEDAKRFYRELGRKSIEINEPPEMQEVENFWSKLWKGVRTHNSSASWIKDQEKINEHQEQQKLIDITKDEDVLAIMKSSNWKAPGNDGIANFWIKNLTSIHEKLTTAYNDILKHPETSPDWLTEGLSYLLPKTKETKNLKNYRPITCLQTL